MPITTTRYELFEALVLDTPHGFIETRDEHGPGRKYYITVADLMDAFHAFCDDKEASCTSQS